jgi:hypothetical protein
MEEEKPVKKDAKAQGSKNKKDEKKDEDLVKIDANRGGAEFGSIIL